MDHSGILSTEFVHSFEETEFTIIIDAYPAPKVIWMKDDKDLQVNYYLFTTTSHQGGNRWGKIFIVIRFICRKIQHWQQLFSLKVLWWLSSITSPTSSGKTSNIKKKKRHVWQWDVNVILALSLFSISFSYPGIWAFWNSDILWKKTMEIIP